MKPYSFLGRAVVAVAMIGALVGCAASAGTPVASNAFSYACAAGGNCGAFVTLASQGGNADTLVGAKTTVTDRAELHAMVKDANGDMVMQQVASIAVPGTGVLELKPGSFHVMLFGLNRELKVGETYPLTLKYERAGESTVQVQVKAKN